MSKRKSKDNGSVFQARLRPQHKAKLRWLARKGKLSMTQTVETMIEVAYQAARRA